MHRQGPILEYFHLQYQYKYSNPVCDSYLVSAEEVLQQQYSMPKNSNQHGGQHANTGLPRVFQYVKLRMENKRLTKSWMSD